MTTFKQTLIAGVAAVVLPALSYATPMNVSADTLQAAAGEIPQLQPAQLRPARADSHELVPGAESVMLQKASVSAAHEGEIVLDIPVLSPYTPK